MSFLFYDKKIDLYNLAKFGLGYNKLSDNHKVWSDDLERKRASYKRIMRLKPRGTYKSTIYTVSYIIERLIEDWIENKGTFNIRILLVSSTNELAYQFLGEVKEHLKNNERVREIFGKNVINPKKPDNQQEVWLMPKTVKKEPTIKAKGALSAMVSEHYDLIIVDDLVNNDDRESATTREKKWRWYQDLISILDPQGEVVLTGTRWHEDDVYARVIKMNDDLSADTKYDIEVEAIVDENGTPRFPSIYPNKEKIADLKVEKGLVEFYAQYMNNPLPSETQLFSLERMHFYNENLMGRRLDNCKNVQYVDPSLGKEGDYIVVLVGAVHESKLYVRNAFISNTTTPDNAIKEIISFHLCYGTSRCGIESNGFQSLFSSAVKKKNVPVVEVVNKKNKNVRIEGLEPYVTSGQILFRDDYLKVYPMLIEQLIRYPVHKHDDAPDGLEGLMRMGLKKGILTSDLSKLKNLVKGAFRG